MPEMEPVEDEQGDAIVDGEEDSSRDKNEQSARSFFAVLCFFIAFIFLISFVNNPQGSVTGLLVLFGIFAFGLGGMYLLSSGSTRKQGDASSFSRAQPGGELSPFELLVEEALASIPAEFQEQMANLVVLVESEADEEVLERVGNGEGYILLGLYQGVPVTTYGHAHALLPERITIYQRAIEAYCHGDPERVRAQVRSTVLHEVAHHFGMDHAEMPIWIK